MVDSVQAQMIRASVAKVDRVPSPVVDKVGITDTAAKGRGTSKTDSVGIVDSVTTVKGK